MLSGSGSSGRMTPTFALVFEKPAKHGAELMRVIADETVWLIIRNHDFRANLNALKTENKVVFERVNAIIQTMRVYGVDCGILKTMEGVTIRHEKLGKLRGIVFHLGIAGGTNHYRLGFEVLDEKNRIVNFNQIAPHESFTCQTKCSSAEEKLAILKTEGASREYNRVNTLRKNAGLPLIDFAKRFGLDGADAGASAGAGARR